MLVSPYSIKHEKPDIIKSSLERDPGYLFAWSPHTTQKEATRPVHSQSIGRKFNTTDSSLYFPPGTIIDAYRERSLAGLIWDAVIITLLHFCSVVDSSSQGEPEPSSSWNSQKSKPKPTSLYCYRNWKWRMVLALMLIGDFTMQHTFIRVLCQLDVKSGGHLAVMNESGVWTAR